MAYLNDPRENRISPEGETWEQDNREETRYLWNGAYLDLCNLPPSEYMKTIFVTRPEGGSGGGGESGRKEVVIYLNEKREDEAVEGPRMAYWCTSSSKVKMAVKPTAYVSTSKGEEPLSFSIDKGNDISDKQFIYFAKGEMVPRAEKITLEEDKGPDEDYVPDEVAKLPYVYFMGDFTNEEIEKTDKGAELVDSVRTGVPVNMAGGKKTEIFDISLLKQDKVLEGLTDEDIINELALHSTAIVIATDKPAVRITLGTNEITDFNPNGKEVISGIDEKKFYLYILTREDGSLYGSWDKAPEDLILNCEVFFE